MSWSKQRAKGSKASLFSSLRTNTDNFLKLPDSFFLALYFFILLSYTEVISLGFFQPLLSITPVQLIVAPLFLLAIYRCLRKENFIPHIILFIFVTVYLFFIAGNGTVSAQVSAPNFRLCSWNSAYFFEDKKDQAFDILKKQQCTVIFLQEVWNAPTQRAFLISETKKYLPDFDIYTNSEFVILAQQGLIKSTEQSSTFAYFSANIVTSKGSALKVINVHLWNPIAFRPYSDGKVTRFRDPDTERARQSNDFLPYVEASTKMNTPIVIAGDFNTQPTQRLIRSMNNTGSGAEKLTLIGLPWWQNRFTYPSWIPAMQIDYVAVSHSLSSKTTKHLQCYPDISDHCLQIADLLL